MRGVRVAAVASGALVLLLAVLWHALQAPHLPVPEQVDWIFEDVTLVEPGRAQRPGSTLRVRDGVIAEVKDHAVAAGGDAASGLRPMAEPASPGAPDLAGLFVAPGLTDLHVHYPPKVAVGNSELWSLLLLAHGVTSIRETGSIDGSIFAVREAIREGRYPGPRIFACGAMLDGESPSFPSNRVVTTPAAAREAVVDLSSRGADCIKVYNMLSREALAAVREAATQAGLPVIGHAPHSVTLEEAGIADLQHGTGAVVVDIERIGRSDFRAADWSTMDQARIEHVARVSLEQDIAHTPTLWNGRMRLLLGDPRAAAEALARDTSLRHLPGFWVAAWQVIWGAPFARGDDAGETDYQRFRARQAELTARLHAAGVRVHAGTDTLMPFVAPGSSLHGELADLVAAGIAPGDVWAIATREAGRSLGLSGLGTLDVGAPADLVFLRADPSKDLAALGEIEAVLADGRLYRRAELDSMLAAADEHFHGALYTNAMNAVVALVQGGFAPDHDEPRGMGGQP